MLRRVMGPLLGATLVFGCDPQPTGPGAEALDPAVSAAAQASGHRTQATVTFGRNDLGTDFFPPGSHDASFHAKDAIRPRTTVIDVGGTVTFNVAAAHKIAIYEPGIGPRDIDVTSLEPAGTPFPFPPIINDPNGRIVRGPLGFGPTTPFVWTFDQPGKYLVICEVSVHFIDAKMYAWVDVK